MEIRICTRLLYLLLSALCAGTVLAAPSAQVFDAVKKPESVDTQWRGHLCAVLPQPCDGEQLGLFRARGAPPADFVVLSVEPLAFARIHFSEVAKSWQLVELHDFSAYVASLKKRDGGITPDARQSLAPALYPLADGKWAVALLNTVSEMYSGGGASFETADFVSLDDTKAVQVGVPFSCSKMIRACFSDKEYTTSKHCHDESNGVLRIHYGEATASGAPYAWTYTWLQSEWPHDKPHRATTTTRSEFTEKTTSRVDFCSGPQ